MRYLIDTCVFAEYRKPQPNQVVIDWLDTRPLGSMYLSVLTIGEIDKGILRMPDSTRKRNLAGFVADLTLQFKGRILDLDIAIARRWAAVTALLESKGRPLPLIDSLLAATAIENGLVIATRNEADFADTGAEVVNIWK